MPHGEHGDKARGGGFLRFVAVFLAVFLSLTATGLFYVHTVTRKSDQTPRLDFSRLNEGKLPAPAAPVSQQSARVFFAADGRRLGAEYIELDPSMPAYERSRRLLGRLLDGPSSRYYEPVIPSGVSLRGLYILDGEAVVDFSKEIATNLKGGAGREMLTVYAVANTLMLNVREIHRVRILIEGRQCDTLSGEVDLRLPLGPNAGMIQW